MGYGKEGSINKALRYIIKKTCERIRPRSYLEIGVQEGKSLSWVLDNAEIEVVVLCDTWGGTYGGSARQNPKHIQKTLSTRPKSPTTIFLNGDSKKTVPKITMQFDMILVDGDHSERGAQADIENSWKLLKPGGSMIIDDINHPAHKYLFGLMAAFVNKNKGASIYEMMLDLPYGAVDIRKR